MEQILNPSPNLSDNDKHYLWQQIWGDQAKEGAPWEHKNGFTPSKLAGLLGSSVKELRDITVEEEHDGWDLRATAVLDRELQYESLTEMWEEIENNERTS